ncbi:hypothetical protein [Psychrobacter sp. I-STPA10]|uniref:hypothetical protein n=1 Tax=Psychrobacter sp. I-STPA10 TaxID=2585769 RepID=UPI001E63E4E8|nr:hypothetical protein [Psychrobacter sp. I-STPA10]
MAKITPARVSLYDFLSIDTLPIASLAADSGHISIPQAKIVIHCAIEVTVSALLAYQQQFDADSILKKLLSRHQVKELRRYNAFNLRTMQVAMQYGSSLLDALYKDTARIEKISQKIAIKSQSNIQQIRPLLGALTLLSLREIAILADYAQLDAQEIEQWLQLQPQFLQLHSRPIDPLLSVAHTHSQPSGLSTGDDATDINETNIQTYEPISDSSIITPKLPSTNYIVPTFDNSWHELTGFISEPARQSIQNADSIPNYAKVIGHAIEDNTSTISAPLNQQDDRILAFANLPNITLSNQRWLLKLAKIADIYLSRNRLRITAEPKKPPSRPLIPKHLLGNVSDAPIQYDQSQPIWKNQVVLLIIAIIGGLSILAVIKYQYKKANTTPVAESLVNNALIKEALENESRVPDIAIVRVDDDTTETQAEEDNTDKSHQ